MPYFTDWQPNDLKDADIQDYLNCYGLKPSEDIEYQAGYRRIGKHNIFQQYFKQHDPASEMVLVVHGYTDHAGLFAKLIQHLLRVGYSVGVFDFPGHGLSSGSRATINTFKEYQNVLNESLYFFHHLSQCPIHVLGQSLGGAMTMQCLLKNWCDGDQVVAPLGAVVLLAPLVRPRAWRQANWSLRFVEQIFDSIPRQLSNSSENEGFIEFSRFIDPVQHNRLPTEWVGAMLEWVEAFEQLEGNTFPLTVIQGDLDETVDSEYNMQHIGQKFPNLKIHPVIGARHHLVGESDRLQKFIFSYIEEGLSRSV